MRELEETWERLPELVAPVASLWERLDLHDGCCVFCGCEVEEASFPWRYKHHNVHGERSGNNSVSVCMGSRSVYTLKLLGLDAVL
jgi:hypothetical protein